MKIERLYTQNHLRNYDYIIITSCGKVIVLDPSDASLLHHFMLERSLKKIDYYFITHEHPDHIVGLEWMQSIFGGKIVAYQGIKGKIPTVLDQPVKEGDYISFNKESFQVIHIPGHIASHIGFILFEEGREKAAFLGDTVFNGGVGNTHSGDPHTLYKTIYKKVLTLNPELILYPEHDYWEANLKFTLSLESNNIKARELLEKYQSGNYQKTGMFPAATIGEEREYNLFFRVDVKNVQLIIRERCQLPPSCTQEDIFVSLRSLRDQWR